jgi:hypothetical protein
MTRPELLELGAPKMKGQFLASEPMSCFTKKTFFLFLFLFCELDSLDYPLESKRFYARLGYICWIMLELLNWPSFLALRPLHMGKLAPVISYNNV